MTRFVEEKQILKKFQFGFRKKTSTTDALIVFTEFLKMKIDQDFYNPTAFIDLSKAFNSINLDTLLKKLSLIGFDNFSCQLIESFLKIESKEFPYMVNFPNGLISIKVSPREQY